MGHDDLEQAARADEARRIEQARERAGGRAECRELLTEGVVSLAFVAVAVAMAARLSPGPPDPLLALLLGGLCAVLVRVEFEVGEGVTRPVQLVLPSLLLLLPAAEVPLVVALAHLAARTPDVLRRAVPAQRALFVLADSWFSVAPALLVALVGVPDDPAGRAALAVGAFAVQVGGDVVASAVRVRVGVGDPLRSLVRPFAWVYLVDLLLAPVGLVIALAGRTEPLLVCGVLPLAALLAVFARERRGRIENALELHRVTEESKERLQSIVRNASDLILILRPDGRVSTLTGSVATVFGPGWRAVEGTSLFDHVHPDDAALVRAFLADLLPRSAGESQESEWRLRYADGSWRHVAAAATNLVDDPRVQGLVLTARNVDERKALEERLRHRAFHDPLTALANRALFYDRIEHALSRRDGDGHVAVLYVDLDDFKPINDEHGHGVGDELLVQVAKRLCARVRSADTVARLGGDEFGVLLEAVSGPNEPVRTAERLRDGLAERFAVGGGTFALTASIGIAVSDAGERGVDELLRKADLAMYAAKRAGGRSLELYRPALDTGGPRDETARGGWFRTGDEQREEVLSILGRDDAPAIVLQPILDLRTGRVAGYEALSRFPDSRERPPNVWFDQAHRCGLGHELEAKALRSALAVPGRPPGTYLTLNISPSTLVSSVLADVLPERLDDLVIEVTENEVVSEDPAVTEAIAALRRRGARLAVDDTGSGYAGLTHVMRLAPDVIKLDRTLVAGVHDDPVKAALIESFVRYARQIDATVCAEGIETLDDLVRLADLDVSYGQGWAIGRPGAQWPDPAAEAGAACRAALAATLDDPARGAGGHDADLELLCLRLSRATDAEHVAAALPAVARELRAGAVLVAPLAGTPITPGGTPPAVPGPAPGTPAAVLQLLASDPATPAAERDAMVAAGLPSLLRVPVCAGDRHLGTLQAACGEERAWSRHEIRRARIIGHAVGAALARLERPAVEAAA